MFMGRPVHMWVESVRPSRRQVRPLEGHATTPASATLEGNHVNDGALCCVHSSVFGASVCIMCTRWPNVWAGSLGKTSTTTTTTRRKRETGNSLGPKSLSTMFGRWEPGSFASPQRWTLCERLVIKKHKHTHIDTDPKYIRRQRRRQRRLTAITDERTH